MRIVLQALIMTGERFSFNIYPTWLIIFDSTTVQDFYGGGEIGIFSQTTIWSIG